MDPSHPQNRKPKLLDRVRQAVRVRHQALAMENSKSTGRCMAGTWLDNVTSSWLRACCFAMTDPTPPGLAPVVLRFGNYQPRSHSVLTPALPAATGGGEGRGGGTMRRRSAVVVSKPHYH